MAAIVGLGLAFATPTPSLAEDTQVMYRLYNPNSGEHFYTESSYERDSVVKAGWRYEGVGWVAPTTSDTPVYRLYNPHAGDHFYTTDSYERDSLVKVGWRYEGVGWYSGGSVTVYRQYNPNASAGSHNYTTSYWENQSLVKAGWLAEGTAWMAVSDEAAGATPVMGSPSTTVAQMVACYNASGKTYPTEAFSAGGARTIADFCTQLYNEAVAEGVRPEVVFSQAMHETGWLQFGGDVQASQFNFAGIGATGGGAAGNSFSSVAIGLRAQVQHLKAYASTAPLNGTCVDPRFQYVTRGIAPNVQDLGGKWAASASYGSSITLIMDGLSKY